MNMEKRRQNNAERLQQLSQQGVQVNLLPELVFKLLDLTLPAGTDERVAFDSEWELHVEHRLDDIESEVRRAILTRGNGHQP